MPNKLLADANRASLREIVEDNANWGSTPTSGITRARRFTKSSIVPTKDTVVSAEIRDDRMVSSVIETAAHTGGDIDWEFAAGSQDNDFQRVLMGYFTRPMTFDVFRKNVAVTGTNTFTVSDPRNLTPYFVVGRRVRLNGFVAPQNNDYATISAVTFAGGVTTVTVTGATFVSEAQSSTTSVQDANDAVILHSTAIRFGNAARTIDSNGASVFATARAAKQLVAGQRIFVEGVGYEQGTITVSSVADNDEITISDGVATMVFEAQADVDVANVNALFFAIGVDDASTAQNLAAAINTARTHGELALAASVTGAVITVVNLNKSGGAMTNAAGSLAVSVFTGGLPTLGGFYTITSVTDDAIVVDRDVPALAAGKKVTIKASMLRNPGNSSDIQPQSLSLETGFHDVSQYFKSDGLRAGGMTLDVSAGAIVAGTTKTEGRSTIRGNAALLTSGGYTVLDAPATENISASANVGDLAVNGEELSTAIMAIKMTIDGKLRSQKAVGSKYPRGIAAGRLDITGTIDAYFADGYLFDQFLNHETTSLSFPFVDPDKNTYYFTIPAFKIMSDPISPGGTDQDVMESMNFTAFRDDATQCMIQIDRFSSVVPTTAFF